MIFTTISQTPKVEETPQFSLKLLLLFLIILFALSANFVLFCDQQSTSSKYEEATEHISDWPSANAKDIVLNISEK